MTRHRRSSLRHRSDSQTATFVVGRKEFFVSAPYSQDWLSAMKQSVAPKHRIYDKARGWKFDIIVLPIVWKLCNDYFDHVGGDLPAIRKLLNPQPRAFTPPPAQASATSSVSDADFIIAIAPDEALVALYKACAKANHPDLGGDPTIMRKLNEVWDRIRKMREMES